MYDSRFKKKKMKVKVNEFLKNINFKNNFKKNLWKKNNQNFP